MRPYRWAALPIFLLLLLPAAETPAQSVKKKARPDERPVAFGEPQPNGIKFGVR
jgi:hypothetical protein